MENNRFRCHISIIINKVCAAFAFCFIMLLRNYNDVINSFESGRLESNKVIYVLLGGLLISVVDIIYNLFRWYKTWIMIDGQTLVIEKKTINRTRNTIGIKNISNINMQQNIFQKLLHIYQIKLDTNSATTANSTDFDIVLSQEKALEFKAVIEKKMHNDIKVENKINLQNNAQDKNIEYDSINKSYDSTKQLIRTDTEGKIIRYSASQVAKHCLMTMNMITVFVTLAAFGALIVNLVCSFSKSDISLKLLSLTGSTMALFVVFITALYSIVSVNFKYYGFCSERNGDKIYISYGLFNQKKYIIPVNKINSIVIRQNLICRVLKRKYVEIICVGIGDENAEGTQIMLAVTQKEFEDNMSLLLPEYCDCISEELTKQPLNCILPKICKTLFIFVILFISGYALSLVIQKISMYLLIAFSVIVIFTMCYMVVEMMTVGIAMNENYIFIASGGISKKTVMISYNKIQLMDTEQGPLSRRLGLKKGNIEILARTLDRVHVIGYYPEKLFERLHKNILEK